MSGIDHFQLLSLALGVAVLVSVYYDYHSAAVITNKPTDRFVRAVSKSVAFLLVGFALVVSDMNEGSQKDMAKNVVLGLFAASVFVLLTNDVATSGKWGEVAGGTATQLFQGSLVAIPWLYFNY